MGHFDFVICQQNEVKKHNYTKLFLKLINKKIANSSKWLKIIKKFKFSCEYTIANSNVPHFVKTGFDSKGKPEAISLKISTLYVAPFKKVFQI